MTIADRIKYFRKRAGISQLDLGNMLNLERSTISHYETGIRSPDIDTLKRMSPILGVSLFELIDTECSLPGNAVTAFSEDRLGIMQYRYSSYYQESELMKVFRQLDRDSRDILLSRAKELLRALNRNKS